MQAITFHDPLYGEIQFPADILALTKTPMVQRLRHIRLSNIDSIDIPSIANISRFEHVIGVAHLAEVVANGRGIDRFDSISLRASALLHDWAITSFGHLVEEALQYVGTSFDHEKHLNEIVAGEGEGDVEVGGANLQILAGRETGIGSWARKTAGLDCDRLLLSITEHIRGSGKWGRSVAGDIDLDNIDNVYRMAFHMGLLIDRTTPERLAKAMVGLSELGQLVFEKSALLDIRNWQEVRRDVYESLMLGERDFLGKIMMLFAIVRAYQAGEITLADWRMVDYELMGRILSSRVKEVKDTAERWVAGELWEQIPLCWMSGERPSYARLLSFSEQVSGALDRTCFAYGIKDKRDRQLTVSLDDGSTHILGNSSSQWLLGVGSPKRKPFTREEGRVILDHARSVFHVELIEQAGPAEVEQARLI